MGIELNQTWMIVIIFIVGGGIVILSFIRNMKKERQQIREDWARTQAEMAERDTLSEAEKREIDVNTHRRFEEIKAEMLDDQRRPKDMDWPQG